MLFGNPYPHFGNGCRQAVLCGPCNNAVMVISLQPLHSCEESPYFTYGNPEQVPTRCGKCTILAQL